ncbi:MAG: hypothetical protein HKO92_02205 [Flavobacteriaceae bacterium]|nr:hypothetical protein [Flavobacteriaceae bacterium]
MINEFISSLDEHIQNIVKCSKVNRVTAEQVINTQIALIFSDLAVKSESEFFLGKITYKNNKLNFTPNDRVSDLLEGKIDPSVILKEIFENV